MTVQLGGTTLLRAPSDPHLATRNLKQRNINPSTGKTNPGAGKNNPSSTSSSNLTSYELTGINENANANEAEADTQTRNYSGEPTNEKGMFNEYWKKKSDDEEADADAVPMINEALRDDPRNGDYIKKLGKEEDVRKHKENTKLSIIYLIVLYGTYENFTEDLIRNGFHSTQARITVLLLTV
jgi:hypothetical protein